jgi:hypothetical protein
VRARAWTRVPHSSFSRNEGVPGSSPGVGLEKSPARGAALFDRGDETSPAGNAGGNSNRGERRSGWSGALPTRACRLATGRHDLHRRDFRSVGTTYDGATYAGSRLRYRRGTMRRAIAHQQSCCGATQRRRWRVTQGEHELVRRGVADVVAARSGYRPVLLATGGVPFRAVGVRVRRRRSYRGGRAPGRGQRHGASVARHLGDARLRPVCRPAGGRRFLPRAGRPCPIAGRPARAPACQEPAADRSVLHVVAERAPDLVVFDPDRGRIRGQTYRNAARLIRERASYLVWLEE